MLNVENISKRLGNFTLTDMSFTVRKGEYFILLGVSGAGKSLLLEMIAGLTVPDSGTIRMEGTDITRKKIQDRGIGLVFQDYAVFPHLTVSENVGYSLHHSPLRHSEKRQRIRDIATKMNIDHLL